MPELETVTPATDAGYVQMSAGRAKRKARLAAEEAELKALLEGKDEAPTPEEEDLTEPDNGEEKEDTKEKVEPSTAEERTFKQRYGDLRRHSQAREAELKAKIEELKSNQSNGQSMPPKTEEELQEWMNKYPDVASIVKSIANKEAANMVSETSEKLRLLEEREYELKVQNAEQVIRKSHPDFDKLRDSDDFHDWADNQSKWVQDALYENETDPKAVISVINLYKIDAGLNVSAKKERQKAAASVVEGKSTVTPGTKEKPTYSESQIAKNSDAWYEKHQDAIALAMREGRFTYDLSRS